MGSPLEERKSMAREVLAEAPRLTGDDVFRFACHPGVSCFNSCCGNVSIVLTPYDVWRLSRRLGLSTTDFLAQYTFVPFSAESKLPFVFLRMADDEKKSCPLVTPAGCSVYEDRPWPCRMYPVGQASPADPGVQGEGFYFLMREDHCRGHQESRSWTVNQWIDDQGVSEYEEWGELFKQVLLHPYLQTTPLDPARMEMFYMASYDLDKFREFVFRSKFLSRFDLAGLDQRLKSDDRELLRFAVRWLRFALFGELTMKIRPELLSDRERAMLEKNRRVEME